VHAVNVTFKRLLASTAETKFTIQRYQKDPSTMQIIRYIPVLNIVLEEGQARRGEELAL
jgi:hypothetical protein